MGSSLAHHVLGSGPPLLLLHGTPSSRHEWDPLVPLLAPRRTLILVDLPGFGDSPVLPGGWLPSDWVTPIGDLLDELGIGRCDVLGSSMGGWTGLELAKANRAESLIALAPAGLWARRSPPLTNFQLSAGQATSRLLPTSALERLLASKTIRRAALRSASRNAAAVAPETAASLVLGARRASGWKQHYRAAKATRFTGGQDISVPTKIIWGAKDPIAPARSSRHTDQLPSGATIETWAGCGHLLAWDAPERVARLIGEG